MVLHKKRILRELFEIEEALGSAKTGYCRGAEPIGRSALLS